VPAERLYRSLLTPLASAELGSRDERDQLTLNQLTVDLMCDAPARAEDPDHGAREPGRAGLCRRADQQEKAAVPERQFFGDPDIILI
jgi:hypothetical protein